MSSSPDAIGLISWNEYSENSQVEPSREYGTTALKVVASIEHAKAPVIRNFDSSAGSDFRAGQSQLIILAALIVILGGSVAAIALRKGARK